MPKDQLIRHIYPGNSPETELSAADVWNDLRDRTIDAYPGVVTFLTYGGTADDVSLEMAKGEVSFRNIKHLLGQKKITRWISRPGNKSLVVRKGNEFERREQYTPDTSFEVRRPTPSVDPKPGTWGQDEVEETVIEILNLRNPDDLKLIAETVKGPRDILVIVKPPEDFGEPFELPALPFKQDIYIFHYETEGKCGVYDTKGDGAKIIKPAVISSMREFAEKKFRDNEVLLEVSPSALANHSTLKSMPVLFHPSLGEVHAYRGTGKTNWGVGAFNAFATGGEFLCYKAPRPFKTLYVDGELPGSDLQLTLRDLVAENDNFNLIAYEEQEFIPSIAFKEGQDWLDEAIDRIGAEIVGLDSWSMLAKVGSNEEEAWQSFQEWQARCRKRGVSVIYFQHDGKKGLQRGHSKPEDLLNWVVQLKWEGNYKGEEGLRCLQLFDKARRPVGKFGRIRMELTEGLWTWSFPTKNEEPEETPEEKKTGRKLTQPTADQLRVLAKFSEEEMKSVRAVSKTLCVGYAVAGRWVEQEIERRKEPEEQQDFVPEDAPPF
jgi:hypothetical protein